MKVNGGSSKGEMTFVKISTALALGLGFLALIMFAVTPPANGYEISIYAPYSDVSWFVLVLSVGFGTVSLVFIALRIQTTTRLWMASLGALIVVDVLMILLPILRGYYLSDQTDEVSHLGMINDIARTGHCDGNLYPFSHILAYQLSSISGIQPRLLMKLIPSLFYLVFVGGVYLLAKSIGQPLGPRILTAALSTLLLFSFYSYVFYPTQFFLELIPFVLFLLIRKTYRLSLANSVAFLAAILPLPFLHPMGSIFLVIILLIYETAARVSKKAAHTTELPQQRSVFEKRRRVATRSAAITLILLLLWFQNFSSFGSTLQQAYRWGVYGAGTPGISTLNSIVNTGSFSAVSLIILIAKQFGHDLLLSVISLAAVMYILVKRKRPVGGLDISDRFFSLMFVVFSFIFVVSFLGAFTPTAGLSIRMFTWAIVASIFLSGRFLHAWLSKKGRASITSCAVLILLLFASTCTGIFTTYYSPYISNSNQEVSHMSWEGVVWFYSQKSDDRTIYFEQLTFRAPDALYGYATEKPPTVGAFSPPPPHLGYDTGETIADTVQNHTYLVVGQFTREFKSELWPTAGLFTLDDLNRLELDPYVDRIYVNGDSTIYQVVSQ